MVGRSSGDSFKISIASIHNNLVVNLDFTLINDFVGKGKKSQMHIVAKLSGICSTLGGDGIGGESLIEAALKSEGKGLSCGAVKLILLLNKGNVLSLSLLIEQKVISNIQNVIAMGAHSLGAVNISVLGITHTLSVLLGVPFFVRDSVVGVRFEVRNTSLTVHSSKGKIVKVLASSMARAIIRAGSSGAGLAFVAIKALAKTGGTITDSLASALSIVVERSITVGRVNPCDLKGANAIRAITTLA
jgi:hypothetical protein